MGRFTPWTRSGRAQQIQVLTGLLATGVLLLAFVWMAVQRRSAVQLATANASSQPRAEINYWLKHGYFASFGLLVPTTDETLVYRSSTGAYMVTGYLLEKVVVAFAGRPSWTLLALHNDFVALLTATLAGLLTYRLARRSGTTALHSFVLGVCVQCVQFTFPDNLALFWAVTDKEYWLIAALAFLLLKERAVDRPHTRAATGLQMIAAFGIMYFDYGCGVMFIAAYTATILLLRDERPPLRRIIIVLVLPSIAAIGLFGLQLAGVHFSKQRTGAHLTGSTFAYRSGLDGDTALYGDHLDIAYGRAIVRGTAPERQHLFRWPALFVAGMIALLAIVAAYIAGHAPRIAFVALASLTGTYLLYAALLSQAVALHPYLYDALLATPLIIGLFGVLPALAESWTRRSGAFAVITLIAAVFLTCMQLRLYAIAHP